MQRDKNRRLFEIAESQQGLFTARQAERAGFIRTNHAYHVKAGHWVREERGIYRMVLFPHSPEEQLVAYSLWSQNRDGKVQGVYSHATALSRYELSDINPTKIHMTVPKDFRRNSEIPKVLVLHHANLAANDIEECLGFQMTKPIRTIQDVIEDRSISFEFINQAIVQALRRGLIRKSQIERMLANVKVSDAIKRDIKHLLLEVA